MTVSRVTSAGGMSVRRLQHSRRICAMEPPFATPRASQEKGACASIAWFSHRLGAVTSTLNRHVKRIPEVSYRRAEHENFLEQQLRNTIAKLMSPELCGQSTLVPRMIFVEVDRAVKLHEAFSEACKVCKLCRKGTGELMAGFVIGMLRVQKMFEVFGFKPNS